MLPVSEVIGELLKNTGITFFTASEFFFRYFSHSPVRIDSFALPTEMIRSAQDKLRLVGIWEVAPKLYRKFRQVFFPTNTRIEKERFNYVVQNVFICGSIFGSLDVFNDGGSGNQVSVRTGNGFFEIQDLQMAASRKCEIPG
jgi:hypothetical protein